MIDKVNRQRMRDEVSWSIKGQKAGDAARDVLHTHISAGPVQRRSCVASAVVHGLGSGVCAPYAQTADPEPVPSDNDNRGRRPSFSSSNDTDGLGVTK